MLGDSQCIIMVNRTVILSRKWEVGAGGNHWWEGETKAGRQNRTRNEYLLRPLLNVALWLFSPGGWNCCYPVLCYQTHHQVSKGWGSSEDQGPSTHNRIIPGDQCCSVLCYDWESQSFLPVVSPPSPFPLPLNLLVCSWHCCSADSTHTWKWVLTTKYRNGKNWSARAGEPSRKGIFHSWWAVCTFSPQVDMGGTKDAKLLCHLILSL